MSTFVNPPAGSAIISVSIIDSTCDLVCTAKDSIKPVLDGQSYLNMGTYVFLLEHTASNTRLLFDGGCRKDWWNLPECVVESIRDSLPGMRTEKNVNEILREGGVDDSSIDFLVWSHHHFDHIGDASLFPVSTSIIVGNGFKDELLPGFPTNPDAELLDSDFAGREVREIEFNDSFKIAGFRAFDFFSDGALLLLDTPGHAVGHISALVRTTANTFVFLGGDICDAPQAWRPTQHVPMPLEMPPSVPLDHRLPRPCPSSIFLKCHPEHPKDSARTTPYCQVSDAETSLYEDPEVAQQSVESLKVFDADPNILVCVAHDASLLSVLPFFPKGTLNGWKEKGWKEATAWGFVNELPIDSEPGRRLLVDGLYRGTQKLRSAADIS